MRGSDRKTRTARVAIVVALAALGLIVAACGGADDPSGSAGRNGSAAEGAAGGGDVDVGPDPDNVAEAQPASAHPELTARAADGSQTTEPQHPKDPVAVTIPAIGVDSPLVRLGLNRDRSMEVPEDFSLAGWYVHAPRPGEVGPAVIAGHVSSSAGPGVFHKLAELSPGDRVRVTRADGRRVSFIVDRVEQHPKGQLAEAGVYDDTGGPELRLITCGGEFDRQARSHRANTVVFASA